MENKFKDTVFVFTFLLKVLIFAGSIYYIYYHLFVINNILVFITNFNKALSLRINVLLIFIVSIMMCLNWLLEAFKWKLLIDRIHVHELKQAVKSILAGTTVGVFTPNRIGEVAGRLIFLKAEERIIGLVLAGIGSLAQFFITIILGVIAAGFLFKRNALVNVNLSAFSKYVFVLFFVVFLLFFILIQNRIKIASKFKLANYLNTLKGFLPREIFNVLLLSFSRYIVFFFQFLILLYVFDVKLSFQDALVFIPSIFFVITIVPSFIIADIGIRGAVSVFFLGFVSSNESGIFAASLSLWLINIAVPAIAGNFVIMEHRFKTNL